MCFVITYTVLYYRRCIILLQYHVAELYNCLENLVSHTSSYSLSLSLSLCHTCYRCIYLSVIVCCYSARLRIPNPQYSFLHLSHSFFSLFPHFPIPLSSFTFSFSFPYFPYLPLSFPLFCSLPLPIDFPSAKLVSAFHFILYSYLQPSYIHNHMTRSYTIHDKSAFATKTYTHTYARANYTCVNSVTHMYASIHTFTRPYTHTHTQHTYT